MDVYIGKKTFMCPVELVEKGDFSDNECRKDYVPKFLLIIFKYSPVPPAMAVLY